MALNHPSEFYGYSSVILNKRTKMALTPNPPPPPPMLSCHKCHQYVISSHESVFKSYILHDLSPEKQPGCMMKEDTKLTIFDNVLISARTQSGQSRSPQNRNLCKEKHMIQTAKRSNLMLVS